MVAKKQKVVVVAAATTLALSGLGQFVAGPSALAAQAAVTATSGQSVIVVLRDQRLALPANRAHVSARRAQTLVDQDAVIARLSQAGRGTPGKVRHYVAANAVSLIASADQAAELAADPAVAAVIPDSQVAIPVRRLAADSAVTPGVTPTGTPPSTAVCPSGQAKPLLEPEALQDTNTASDEPSAKTAQQLTDGSGTKVAYIADAIDPDNPDFIRANGDHVIVDYKAFSADGPTPAEGGAEAYGDASAIAAQGLIAHDLSTFVNPAYPLPAGCNIRILGMAPGANIVALKTDFFTSSIVQAIDYAVATDHVDVLNESFGGNPVPDAAARSAISLFNDGAVAAGTTVTVSSGDAGTTSTIGNPATDPNVISVAASTNNRTYAQTGYAGARFFGNGKWVNDQISSLSSGGFTQSGNTVDITAPGEAGWAVCDDRSSECTNYRGGRSNIQPFGGTSQSAPLTAGAAALVISAYRSTHGGSSPTPALVKSLLTSTASDLGLPTYEQGAGLLDARAAVEAALTYPGATTPAPVGVRSNINLSTSQLAFSGAPGSTHSARIGVTNVGTHALTVAAATRDYLTTNVQAHTTALDASTNPTFPYPTTGAAWAYKQTTFTVPAGTDRLAVQMYWQGASKQVGTATVTPVVRLSVFDPSGAFIANSRPQGGSVSANYANLDLRRPAAGTYTAVLYTPAGAAGYSGPVSLRTTSQRAVPIGQISAPAFKLAPGQTKSVRVAFTVPASGGDTSYAVRFASSDGHQTAVAVVARTVVPTSGGHGSFGGLITGGNARGGSAAQSFSYAFDVPAGKRDLDVGVTLASDPNYLLEGVLVDPNDETQSVDSNLFSTDSFTLGTQGRDMQLTTANPIPGRWRVVINVVNPVPGTAFDQAFTGAIGFNENRVRAVGLPNSTHVKLPAGKAVTAQVKVTNTGRAPINVQVDPRTTRPQNIQLVSPFGSQSFQLPAHAAPTFLVPPSTTRLTATEVSDIPAVIELTPGLQGIDVVGDLKAGQNGSTVSVATVEERRGTVSTGVWYTDVTEVGAVDSSGAPTASSTVDLTARTPGFDSTVTSSTGDFWALTVNPNADLGNPVTVLPGQTRTVSVTITPTGKKGTKVSGVLNIITPPSLAYATFSTTGDVLAQVPYSYTVGR